MDFQTLIKTRYTCKYYDSQKKISDADFNKILEAARLSPSAVNMQPWYFFVAATKEAKDKIKDAVMEMNMQRFEECSHVVALCTRTVITEDYINKVVDKEDSDGRFGKAPNAKAGQDAGKKNFAGYHKISPAELISWNARNTYIALASMLYAAADLGIDATPVEGMYPHKVDELLGLDKKGLGCLCLVFFGYKSAQDSNTLDQRPKSRLNISDIVTVL